MSVLKSVFGLIFGVFLPAFAIAACLVVLLYIVFESLP